MELELNIMTIQISKNKHLLSVISQAWFYILNQEIYLKL